MLLKPAIRQRLLSDPQIAGLLKTRVYSRWAGSLKEMPLCVISCPRREMLTASDGPTPTRHARVSIDLFDTDPDRADVLARRIEARLAGWTQKEGSPAISSFLPEEGEGEQESIIEKGDGSDVAILVTSQAYDVWFTNEA